MTKHFLQPILILLVILVPPILNANGIGTLLSTLRKELKALQKTAYRGSHEANTIDQHIKFLENFQQTDSGLVVLKGTENIAELIFKNLVRKDKIKFQKALEGNLTEARNNLSLQYDESDVLKVASDHQQRIFNSFSASGY